MRYRIVKYYYPMLKEQRFKVLSKSHWWTYWLFETSFNTYEQAKKFIDDEQVTEEVVYEVKV